MLSIIKYISAALRASVSSVASFNKHEGFEHAGYLSFLLMLAIFPFLILMVSIVSLIGEKKLSVLFVEIILSTEVEVFLASIKQRIIEIITSPPEGLLTFVALSAVWTSSSMLEGIKTFMNKAYHISSPPNYLFRRLFSIIEFMVVLVFILTVLAVMLFAPIVLDYLAGLLHINPDNNIFQHFFDEGGEIVRRVFLIVFGFALILGLYHFIPNNKGAKLRFSMPGAVLVLVLWIAFSMLFKFYIKYFAQLNIVYGGIAGIIITLIFFYVCSVIFIYGAEFNYQLNRKIKNN